MSICEILANDRSGTVPGTVPGTVLGTVVAVPDHGLVHVANAECFQ